MDQSQVSGETARHGELPSAFEPAGFSRRDILRGALGVSAAAALGPLLAACGSSGSSGSKSGNGGKKLAKVSLQLNFTPNGEHAPYYLGKSKGFYKDQGIDIDIRPGTGSAVAATLVGAGKANFGVAVADAVTVARGAKVPVKSLAVLLQQTPTELASLKSAGITQPADLYGKKVGVDTASTIYAFWKAFAKVNNLDSHKITLVNSTASPVSNLTSHVVDATGLLATNEAVVLEQSGHPLNIISYYDHGVKSYGQVLFSSDKYISENSDIARRFTAATIESWKYTLAHVDEAIDALAAAVPQTKKPLEAAKWVPIKKLVETKAEQQHGFGYQDLLGWKQTYDTFAGGGLIKTAFDPSDLFTTAYSPK